MIWPFSTVTARWCIDTLPRGRYCAWIRRHFNACTHVAQRQRSQRGSSMHVVAQTSTYGHVDTSSPPIGIQGQGEVGWSKGGVGKRVRSPADAPSNLKARLVRAAQSSSNRIFFEKYFSKNIYRKKNRKRFVEKYFLKFICRKILFEKYFPKKYFLKNMFRKNVFEKYFSKNIFRKTFFENYFSKAKYFLKNIFRKNIFRKIFFDTTVSKNIFRKTFFEKCFFEKYCSKNIFRKIFFD